MKKSIHLLTECNLVVATLLMICFICGCNQQSKYAVPETLYADVKVQSVGGTSLFDTKQPITIENFTDFYSDPKVTMEVVGILRSEGFRVLHVNNFGINIAAPPEVFERVFKTKIIVRELKLKDKRGVERIRTVYDVQDAKLIGFIDPSDSPLANLAEGVALSEPVEFFELPTPPPVNYYHLEVPDDVSQKLNAIEAHSKGYTGKGVKVIMIDGGWYRHPFFDEFNYNIPWVVQLPGDYTDSDLDSYGHGTGISSNLFAVAPDVDLLVIKIPVIGEEWGINAVACFNVAVDMAPDIITCSWGDDVQDELDEAWMLWMQLGVYYAFEQGITVVFAAGNGQFGFPAQMPQVIAAGGAYIHEDNSIEASQYASGFVSEVYEGRIVPDVCGLVGIESGYSTGIPFPGGMYIMMPTQPGSYCDVKYHNNGYIHYRNPDAATVVIYGDETASQDGWLVASGTSSAAPQIAGICALLKEIHPAIRPSYVKEILRRTARDVARGHSSSWTGRHVATEGFDTATGEGLVDALSAVSYLEDRIENPEEFLLGLHRENLPGQYYRYVSDSSILQLYRFSVKGGPKVSHMAA